MYRPGHTGVALLVYAPLGYALLISGRAGLAVSGGALVVALAMLPDYDIRIPGLTHRGGTHTFLFALCTGIALGAGGWVLADFFENAVVGLGGTTVRLAEGVTLRVETVSPVELGAFGFAVGVLTVCSHLLADVLTPMGIAPLWPASSKRFSFDVVNASNAAANALLLAFGVCAIVYVVWLARPIG